MSTIAEIEAAFSELPMEQKYELYGKLARQLPAVTAPPELPSTRHSFLDIPSVHLGAVLQPFTPEDDLFGEMLEGRT